MKARIAVLGGDGIGPEVAAEAVRVLRSVASRFGHEFEFVEALIGGAAIDASGSPLPPRTIDACRTSDGVLLGAVGGPQWSDPSARVRPEQGLLELRRVLGVFANLRPVRTQPDMLDASPLRPEVIAGVDIMVVRELTGGIYFGRKSRTAHEAEDVCSYSATEIERVTRVAGRLAMARRRHIVSVDKANVLETSRLWRTVVERVLGEEFPEIRLEHMLVDAAAMHLLRRPTSFDVLLTENMFGDILTDEASMLVGSLGLLPSASLGDRACGSLRADPWLGARHCRPRHRQPDRHDPERRPAAAALARSDDGSRSRRGGGRERARLWGSGRPILRPPGRLP
jgi:3-isopropylmalate dehydrogenase